MNRSRGNVERKIDWISKSKFAPPNFRQPLLPRTQLSDQFEEAFKTSLTLVEAPAGYGKTVLLSQWHTLAKARRCTPFWLSLDEFDSKPEVFVASLIYCLSSGNRSLTGTINHALSERAQRAPLDAMRILASELSSIEQNVFLFLDDMHRAASEEVLALFRRFLAECPSTFHVCISTRTDLRLGVSKLSTAGNTHSIDLQDLRFTVDEVRDFLAGFAPLEDIEPVFQRTEGWPVVLQLLKVSLQRKRVDPATILQFSGRTTEMAKYLAEQVFDDLPPTVKDMLLRTSILQRMNGDIANEMCGRRDGWEALEMLVRDNLLVMPLDMEGGWFRYHHLFADFLQDRLKRAALYDICELHRTAAAWFTRQGFLHEAVYHARLSADEHGVAKLLSDCGGWLVGLRGGLPALRLFEDVPYQSAIRYPTVRLGQIYLLAQTNRLAEARAALQDLKRQVELPDNGSSLLAAGAQAIAFLIGVYAGSPLDIHDASKLESTVRLLPDADPFLSAIATHLLAYAQYVHRQYAEAVQTGSEAIARAHAIHATSLELYASYVVGNSLYEMGNIRQAEVLFCSTVRKSQEVFGERNNLASAGQAFLAKLKWERGDWSEADALLRGCLPDIISLDSWFALVAAGYDVASKLTFAQSGLDSAIAVLASAERSMERWGLTRQKRFMKVLKAEIHARAAQLDQAAAILAELDQLEEPEDGDRCDLHPAERVSALEVRIEIARNDLSRAQELLATVDDLARRTQENRAQMRVCCLLAQLRFKLGERTEGIEALRKAFSLALGLDAVGILADEFLAGPELARDAEILRPQLSASEAKLLDRITSLVEGFRPGFFRQISRKSAKGTSLSLSTREQQILSLLHHGCSGKEIADRLNLSLGTVTSYRKNLYRKLQVTSRSRAISKAIAHHLL